jgi:hypothetical protein
VEINRGKSLVTNVDICDGSWEITPKLPLAETHWNAVGHYSLKQDPEADRIDMGMFHLDEVWYGAIDSLPIQLILTKGCAVRLNAESQRQ